jgi:hypothetical protein
LTYKGDRKAAAPSSLTEARRLGSIPVSLMRITAEEEIATAAKSSIQTKRPFPRCMVHVPRAGA